MEACHVARKVHRCDRGSYSCRDRHIGRGARADDPKYPNWKGQWERFIGPGLPGRNGSSHDQTRPPAYGQQAPLTPEYAAVLDASIADQVNGGLGNSPTSRCFPAGMPHMMMAFGPQEYVITPETTYILINWDDHNRRIFTDGRDWPERLEPTFSGYSIGKWIDEDGDGRRRGVLRNPRRLPQGGRRQDGQGTLQVQDPVRHHRERHHL